MRALSEALLFAYSAMGSMNLKAVGRGSKIVRELDRYHGFVAAAWRRLPEAADREAPVEGTSALSAALFCRAEFGLQGFEPIEFAPGIASATDAADPVGAA